MSDITTMYTEMLALLEEQIPASTYGDIRRLRVLAWALTGLCDSRSVALSAWAAVIESAAQYAASRVRRLRRWLAHPALVPAQWYAPLLQHALSDWATVERWWVSLDTSQLGAFVLIRAALIYRGRAIPLAWRVLRHASASVSYDHYVPVLAEIKTLFPAAPITLLADRGFYHEQLLTLAETYTWHYRIRIPSDTQVQYTGQTYRVTELCPGVGQATCYQHVSVLNGRHPDVCLALGIPEDQPTEMWLIVSDETTSLATFDEYGWRFDIEENFLDDKSNGFGVEASRLDAAPLLDRLFFVLAVATLYFTSIGVGVVRAKKRRWVDTHWDRGLSYFKIGWQWVRQQVRRHWPRWPAFVLDPTPDPAPACASRQQALDPPRHWKVSIIDCESA